MKTRLFIPVAVLIFAAVGLHGAESIEEAMKRATLDYSQRLSRANEELVRVRERIAAEKLPLMKATRAAEDRIIAIEAEITRLGTAQEQSLENQRQAARDLEVLRKSQSYLNGIAHDSLVAFESGLLPGEEQFLAGKIQPLQEVFDPAAPPGRPVQIQAATQFLRDQVQQALGGHTAPGASLIDGGNRLIKGTFAFAGPEVFFLPEQGPAGTVRRSEEGGPPVTYPLPQWKPASAQAFFQGQMGSFPADASGGKALRLKQAKGSLLQHINKGGIVSYAILGVGLLALALFGQKLRDLSKMAVATPEAVQDFLNRISTGRRLEAESSVRTLKASTRELFTEGIQNLDEPPEILQETLDTVLLHQRLHFERRLPLLAVIATAAPLMGLLGTVTGMVRTFTLITVFGTGNAGHLAGGISEVLVATELGLMVAIPALIAHGFLSLRIQKNLALLEGQAQEFVTAAQRGKAVLQSPASLPA